MTQQASETKRPTDEELHAEKQAYIEGTQSGWDAAIEAAANVAQGYGCCHVPREIAEEIRVLKEKPK